MLDENPAVPPHALDLLAALSTASLNSLASAAASALAENITSEQQIQVDNEAFAAMSVLVTSFAKNGGSRPPAEQRQHLYTLGVEDDDLQLKLMRVLATVGPSVEHVLENTYFDFAHVIDVNWRLDYVLCSSRAGKLYESLYIVQLRLQLPCASDLRLQTLIFSCSVEELRSLVYRIQEVTNEVEKLAAGISSRIQ